MRINIITNLANGIGLQRDFEAVVPKLQAAGHDVAGVQFDRPGRPGLADVNLFLEVHVPHLFGFAREQWMVPNPEWCLRGWVPNLRGKFSRIFCKTPDAYRIFSELMEGTAVACIDLGWESRDLYDPAVPRERRFLHVPGKSQNKNTAAILRAWRDFEIPYELTVITEHYPEAGRIPNVTRLHRIGDDELARLMNACQFHLCPSEYEGWGHYLHEGLGCGAVVITTDAAPMNRTGAPEELLVPVAWSREHGCAALHAVTAEAIVESVTRAVAWGPEKIRETSEAARAGFLRSREDFRSRFETAFAPTNTESVA